MAIAKQVVEEVKQLVKGGRVFEEPGALYCHSYDATMISFLPDLVVEPLSAEQTSKVLQLARAEGIPVVPRGAGTCQTGGPLPVAGGIVLSLKLMNRILRIDPEERLAIVEPGVVNGDLQETVLPHGLFYPPDPSSYKVSTIGGNIAECAGGPRCLKYGVTKDFVQGLEVVLPDGEILDTGPYGFLHHPESAFLALFIGSEGTLGVVTKAYLKLVPLPSARRSLQATFAKLEQVGEVVHRVFDQGLLPSKMEFMDRVCLNLVEEMYTLGLDREAEALLLIEVDGEAEAVEEELSEIEAICRSLPAKGLRRSSSAEEEEAIWRARGSLSPTLSRATPIKINEDIVVPRGKLVEVLMEIQELSRRFDLRVATYGHVGDGNLHTNLLLQDDPEEKRRGEEALAELFRLTLRSGGSVSGEHGIGLTKVKYLDWEIGQGGREAMVKVREALNPRSLMNPYKIFVEPGAEALQQDSRLR